MFEKIIFFNIMFSRFFIALASQNGSKIQNFFKLFRKPRLGENPYKTLVVRRKIKIRTLKNQQTSIQQRARQRHREKHPKKRCLLPFGLPKTSQNLSKIGLGREQMGSRTKLVSRRYGNRAQVVEKQRGPAFVKRPKGYAYD